MAHVNGIDYLVKIGGTTIGGGTGATLTVADGLIDTTNKGDAGWHGNLSGVREWSLDFEGMYLDSSAEIGGDGATVTYGGATLAQVRTITVSGATDVIDATDQDSNEDRELLAGTRTVTVEVEGLYTQIPGTSLQAIIDQVVGDTANTGTLTIDYGTAEQITGTARVSDFSIGAPNNDVMPYSVSFTYTGAVTITDTNNDTGAASFITNWTSGSSVTALLTNATTSDIEYTGTAFPMTFSIEIPYDGAVTMSGTFEGSGALTDQLAS